MHKGRLPKKKSKLRDFDPKGREGSEKNRKFSLLEKRGNHLTPKVPFYLGTLLVNFAYFCKSANHELSKILIF